MRLKNLANTWKSHSKTQTTTRKIPKIITHNMRRIVKNYINMSRRYSIKLINYAVMNHVKSNQQNIPCMYVKLT